MELKAIRSKDIYNIIEYENCFRTEDLYYEKAETDDYINKLNQQLDSVLLRADNWKALCFASEKAYKKLLLKYIHEASIAESYRSLIYKEDALKYKENGNEELYEELSKKSDMAYRHANRWRRIYRNMTKKEA